MFGPPNSPLVTCDSCFGWGTRNCSTNPNSPPCRKCHGLRYIPEEELFSFTKSPHYDPILNPFGGNPLCLSTQPLK